MAQRNIDLNFCSHGAALCKGGLVLSCNYYSKIMAELKESSLLIKDLKPNMKRVCVIFIVLEIGSPVRIKDGNEVRTVKVADRTGCINMSVWNEKGNLISPGDIIQLTQGNTTVRNGCLTLNVGRYGELVKTGEFCLLFSEQPDCSAYNENWVKLLDQLPSKKVQSEYSPKT
ncbi:soss complex subunit b1 [Echinococcus multilocularis]|uniref:Soss complex subunit b1 n=1 Tax=Echinococcus multilocularis TaxID=6211 RepID=A0A068XZG1_ECHMU|nr:soss complex subunit b1 [Echinococcus multilocularis]